jgi:hypothetical protein
MASEQNYKQVTLKEKLTIGILIYIPRVDGAFQCQMVNNKTSKEILVTTKVGESGLDANDWRRS